MNVWLVRAGKKGEAEDIALDNSIACIGYKEVPSLEGANSREAIEEIVTQSFRTFPKTTSALGSITGQLYVFANSIKEEDLVVLPLKTRNTIAIGRCTGPYKYAPEFGSEASHTLPVEWKKIDIPRTSIKEDLLFTLGAAKTVCAISRNNAVERIAKILETGTDPGFESQALILEEEDSGEVSVIDEIPHDFELILRERIKDYISKNFDPYEKQLLVAQVLEAQGFNALVTRKGRDGGVDIFASAGLNGLGSPRIIVQVKDTQSQISIDVYDRHAALVSDHGADSGLLVSLGGFSKDLREKAASKYFKIQLWDFAEFTDAIFQNYHSFSDEAKQLLPLKQVWALDESEEV